MRLHAAREQRKISITPGVCSSEQAILLTVLFASGVVQSPELCQKGQAEQLKMGIAASTAAPSLITARFAPVAKWIRQLFSPRESIDNAGTRGTML